jgi:hypothetical protein
MEFTSARHFIRLLTVLVIAAAAFLKVRSMVVPADYGTLGHFRAGAIADAASREPRHLGSAACAECHADISEPKSRGKHTVPQCENCHGPGMLHVKLVSEDSVDAYPDPIKKNKNALRPVTGIRECEWCHLKTFERPSVLKSIKSAGEHITAKGGTFTPASKCIDCHNPHTAAVKK